MRYLVLGDVHANLEALEAVLGDCGEYDAALCLGDLIDYGPNPNECVERTASLSHLTCLVGNHDQAAFGHVSLDAFNSQARAAAVWTGSMLSAASRTFLETLHSTAATSEYLLAHASPLEPIWEYLEFEWQATLNFAAFEQPLCFVGHTHVPKVFAQTAAGEHVECFLPRDGVDIDLSDGMRRIVNPGSVGQPRDGDPRASYLIWDTALGTISFHRVAYPFAITQGKILRAGLPGALAYRLSCGR